jgi:hypothetical protein
MIRFIEAFFKITLNYNQSTAEDSLHSLSSVSVLLKLLNWTIELTASLSLILRPTGGQPVCLGIKHRSGAYDQIFVTVRQLRVCWYGALSPRRGRVYRLQLLLALASAVIFESEPHGTHDHILLSQIRDFPFRRLLRLAGLGWRYSTPPPHGLTWQRSHVSSLCNFGENRIEIIISNNSSIIICLSVPAETCVYFIATLWFPQAYSFLRKCV